MNLNNNYWMNHTSELIDLRFLPFRVVALGDRLLPFAFGLSGEDELALDIDADPDLLSLEPLPLLVSEICEALSSLIASSPVFDDVAL